MLFDTHCHLNDPKFEADAAEVVTRARQNGVSAMLVAAYDLPSMDRAMQLSALDGVWIACGIHPHDASSTVGKDGWLEEIESCIKNCPKAIAVGEIGLDYHYDFSPQDIQQEVFRQQIRLAHRLNLPVTIHSRSAEDDVMDILKQESVPQAGAVLHAFTGTSDQARRAVEMGLYIGLTGIITFKKADALRDAVKGIAADNILLETDAPYLAPTPFRGKRNEPAYMREICNAGAELFGMYVGSFAEITTANALKVFRKAGD